MIGNDNGVPEHLVNRILFVVGCTCWPKMCFCIQELGGNKVVIPICYTLLSPHFFGDKKKTPPNDWERFCEKDGPTANF